MPGSASFRPQKEAVEIEAQKNVPATELNTKSCDAYAGPIPEELGGLNNLEVLRLDRNFLTGNFRISLGLISGCRVPLRDFSPDSVSAVRNYDTGVVRFEVRSHSTRSPFCS